MWDVERRFFCRRDGSVARVRRGEQTRKGNEGLMWVCYGVLIGSLLLRLFPLLEALRKPVLFLCVLYLAYKIMHFEQWGREMEHFPQFVKYLFLLILELVIENLLVWVISAVDINKFRKLSPLQDNVYLLAKTLKKLHPILWSMCKLKWVHTIEFLSIAILLPLSTIWDQVPYSGFQMLSRFLLTCVWSRSIRCICFMLTVIPNPKPGCYMKRFPPVPNTLSSFLAIGFQKMKGTGGCNDLIFSGHCALWTLTPLMYHAYYGGRTVLEHHHYSIDMFLAVVITWFVWRESEFVCPKFQSQSTSAQISKTNSNIMKCTVLTLLALVLALILISGA